MSNRWFTQFISTLHKKPAFLDCNFVVDPTNGNGFGVRSLKGAGIGRVYMNTSASFSGTTTNTSAVITGIASGTSTLQVGAQVTGTGIPTGALITAILSTSSIQISLAATASGTVTIDYFAPGSPRPATGLIYVNFQDNWNYYYWGTAGFVSPLSGTPISISTGSSLTIGNAYTITTLGTTTLSQWNAVGVPIGTFQGGIVTGTTALPTVGTTFIATATSGAGTGTVETSTNSGIDHIEVIGDPNQTITSNAATILGQTSGAYMVLQCLNSSGALTAPTAGTTIGLSFFLSNSTIKVKGD